MHLFPLQPCTSMAGQKRQGQQHGSRAKSGQAKKGTRPARATFWPWYRHQPTDKHTSACACASKHASTCTRASTHFYIHTRKHTPASSWLAFSWHKNTHTHKYAHVHMHTCLHARTHTRLLACLWHGSTIPLRPEDAVPHSSFHGQDL